MTSQSNQSIISRPMQTEDDWWRVLDLLTETFPITPPDWNWDCRRWEGNRFHRVDTSLREEWMRNVCLWETSSGKLIGAVHPEGSGDAYLEIHPDYRHLIEEDMIRWAIDNLPRPHPKTGINRLVIFAYDYDIRREALLEKLGFEKSDFWGVFRSMRLGLQPLPPVEIAEGYTLRTTRPGMEDATKIADLLNAAFNRDFHTGEEVNNYYTGAPGYRRDLDLVAEAPDGTFAAYVGVLFEEPNKRGLYEPVCTHPDHRRKRLAQTLMFEGLHRLKALGAETVDVATGDMAPANALYLSIGFEQEYRGHYWRKVIQSIDA